MRRARRATLQQMLRLMLVTIVAACGSGGGFPDARVVDATVLGTFSIDWVVNDDGDRPLDCDRISANSVTVLAHNRAFSGGTTQVFSCRTGTGVSEALPPGIYDFQFQLVGQNGVIATAPEQRGIEVSAGGNVRLTPLTFTVVASGAISLTLQTGRAGNCASAPGGGGITATQIRLEHVPGGTCEPLLLSISAGSTSGASMYQIDCATPVSGPCIDADQAITASPVPSGSYRIRIRAQQGATECWTNDDVIQVPPSGQTLSRALNLALAATPGCI